MVEWTTNKLVWLTFVLFHKKGYINKTCQIAITCYVRKFDRLDRPAYIGVVSSLIKICLQHGR